MSAVPETTRRELGKWMFAEELPAFTDRKTQRWKISNRRGIHLGVVQWENQWRQYVFWPSASTIYAASCLRDLAAFTEELNKAQRGRRR